MNTNLIATLCSYLYIFIVIGIAFVLYRYTRAGSEGVRKFIHIFVSLWVIILVNMYDSLLWALAGPVSFIVANTLFVFSGLSAHLGMGERKRDNGLIYYPISVAVLVIALYTGLTEARIVLASVLIMGFGDGLAALIGSAAGKHTYHFTGGKKSLEGSFTMFAVSLTILFLLYPEGPWYYSLAAALIATLSESLSPLGFDNLTVPLLTAFSLGVMHGIY